MRPIEKDYNNRMAFTMTNALDCWIRNQANKQNVSMSEFIRCTLEQKRDPKALKEYLKNKKIQEREEAKVKKQVAKEKAERKKAREKRKAAKAAKKPRPVGRPKLKVAAKKPFRKRA